MNAEKMLASNRRARHDYLVLATMEAGIALQGSEVKSLRRGQGSLAGAYAALEAGEVWLRDFHIPPYDSGSAFAPAAKRKRKLLLHAREIKRLIGQVALKGNTLIPLKVYLKNGLVKVELAVAKGKKHYDRRADLKEKAAEREMERGLRR
jgi:SsrA-binding protein